MLTFFSIGKQTQKIDDLLWFFNIGLASKNYKASGRQMKTLETLLKDNNHTEAGLLSCRHLNLPILLTICEKPVAAPGS